MTTAVADVDAAFEAALSADAGRGVPAYVPAPPRQERDPEAPHGRAEDGSPLAPYGVKQDGTPRLREPGPGRPKAEDKPRVTSAPAVKAAGAKAAAADYTDDLLGLGTAVWLGISSMKGGALGPVRLPDCRPYAAVWKQTLPQMAAVWNTAAQQNDQVRSAVEKFTGEGTMTWVVGVAVVSAGFVSSCVELAKAPPEVRANATAANDAQLQAYVSRQVEAMGAAA
ncbi:hypothetical protein [Actinospica sp.]|jgi:hypothetical protein|uniref:hypothetical protein n=1 Tax=Actinospica sp. TaxID=1872142 RepID=UPI002BDBF404|nr:hypothetical protein [Actinospica sp.]HWG26111.1 hypothetical protein [Actinospica sp.]